jgi:ComF family protein
MSKAAAWAARALDLVFPRACEACDGPPEGSADGLTCRACAPRAEWIGGPACRRCGAEKSRARCSECGGRTFPFRGAVAAGRYAGFVRELVHRFKFGGRIDLARPLARRIAERVRAAPWGAGIGAIVPVPMRRLKLLFGRGYNPAELLAHRLGRELGRPVRRWLRQTRATPSQTSLTGAERKRNPRGAYRARRARGIVLLVDDVLTTGATAGACAEALLEGGAAAVYLAVVGR